MKDSMPAFEALGQDHQHSVSNPHLYYEKKALLTAFQSTKKMPQEGNTSCRWLPED
jgi:hypothetical protein